MKRSKKCAKLLALAVGGTVGFSANPMAQGSTITWTSTTNQSFQFGGNWGGGLVPGSGDVALFNSSALAPSNSVGFSSDWSLGAIQDNITPTTNLSIGGGGTLTLFGQTVTTAEPSGWAGGSTSFTKTNVILSNTSSLTTSKTLNLNTTLVLNGVTNNILASQGSGGSAGQQITINGDIRDGGVGTHSGLTFLGGGDTNSSGAILNLRGAASFTGGLTIGSADGLQGGAVSVIAGNQLPSTGSIVINEQGQLLLSAQGTYGQPGQLLVVNGIGINKNSSGAIRTGGSGTDLAFNLQSDVRLGQSADADLANQFVVISVTSSAARTVFLNGKFTGTGSLQKQGQGTLRFTNIANDNTGATQIGNGVIQVDAGSGMGTGDLIFFQTSTNTTTINLFNTQQNVGNLSSTFTATSGGSPTLNIQAINLGGGSISNVTLNVRQTSDNYFGYGNDISLTSTIQGPGNLQLDAASNHTLTLTGPNSYIGSTTINGGVLSVANGSHVGSTGFGATGGGTVTVNSGGHLASGNAKSPTAPLSSAFGTITGKVVVNSGGNVDPGTIGTVGTLTLNAGLDAHTGSIFNFDLIGGTTALADRIGVTGAVTLDSGGTETINVTGSQIAFGAYTLMTYNSLGTASTAFALGTTPGGVNRTYSLATGANSVVLTIGTTGVERIWSVGGGNPPVDGSGTWINGGTNWFNTPATTAAPYDNALNADAIFGNAGTGGTVTLGSNIRVGGALVFSPVSGVSSYNIGAGGGTNSLTLAAGAAVSARANIYAPIILEGNASISVSSGATLTINNSITETGGTKGLLKTDSGTLVLNGTASYTGITQISQGALVTSTSSLPVTTGVLTDAALVFRNSANGSYTGQIFGSGSVTINNSAGTVAVTLANATNTYSGPTVLRGGVLSVGNVSNLGSGAGGIIMSGGTLQATASLNFPKGTPARNVTLTPATTSTIDTNGFDLTLNQNIGGAGNLKKIGNGNLTLTGLPSTTIIGEVAIGGGSITLAPPANVPSFGILASSTATNTFVGDLVIAQPMELRLFGGTFGGGGKIRYEVSAIVTSLRNDTVITNEIIGDNPLPDPHAFEIDLNANSGNTGTITGGISGNTDVAFTSGAGTIVLGGTNTYAGNTTIDNGDGGAIIMLGDNTLPTTTGVHVSSTGIWDLNGHSQQATYLDAGAATATVINNTLNFGSPSTLTLIGVASTHFDGFINDGNASTMALKLGTGNTGTLELRGSNSSYTGGTTLNGGTLVVSSDLNITPATPIAFGGGALTTTGSFDSPDRNITITPGSSTISVVSGGTLGLSGAGSTVWSAGATLTVAGGGTLLLSHTGATTIAAGAQSTLGIGTGSTVKVTTPTDSFTDASVNTRHLAVVNNGALLLPTGNSVIAKHSGKGALSITNGATLKVPAGGSPLYNSSGTLTIDTANGSKLDLNNNNMVIDFTPVSTVKSLIISGYNNGAWNGPGIISTSAITATNPKLELGYGLAGDVGITVFGGISVDPSSVLVKYTYAGDANLDGQVDRSDLGLLAAHWQLSSDWTGGDFNYDGLTNTTDLLFMARNFGLGIGAPLSEPFGAALASLGGLSSGSVPEPASGLFAASLVAAPLLRRRRRQRKSAS